ncbi:MAG: flagellar basal body rod protein FlgC [Oscillospiraceae bacterium]|nr:flagellar basal body rod protein FlgC [Oscillospiraceae bacterium]
MAFLDSMSISASALTAERLRMDVIAENMASSNTTRTENGEPYRRKYVVFQEKSKDSSFSTFYNRSRYAIGKNRLYGTGSASPFFHKARRAVGGVRVVEIGEDMSEFKYDYNPTHPDADENGYVRMPNVEVVQEMVDMMSAYRAYEANITAINTLKDMAVKTLEIGK